MNAHHALRTAVAIALATGAAVAISAGTDKAGADKESTRAATGNTDTASANDTPFALGDMAGARRNPEAASVSNPVSGNAEAVQRGASLFMTMNCAGCHGYDARGGMGPDLTDSFWLYGGTPVMIYKSIMEGRPEGMPAWNGVLSGNGVWDLTAYIESLGGSYPANSYDAAMRGDLSKGKTRTAERGASPDTRGRQ